MKYIVLTLAIFSLSLSAITFERTYGKPTYDDWAESVQQTGDDGYIIGGTTAFASVDFWCAYVIKTDSTGDTIWSNASQNRYGRIRSIHQVQGGGFLALAKTVVSDKNKFRLLKYSPSGMFEWAQNYGGEFDDDPYDLCPTNDGNYLGMGITKSYGSGGWDIWIVKFDTSGNMLWDKTVGGVDDDFGFDVAITEDHGFIIAGGTYSWGSGFQDVYLVKIDSMGNQLWSKTYGGADEDVGMAVMQTSDSCYITAGASCSFGAGNYDVYLIKTDSAGDSLWTRTFGGSSWDGAFSLCQSTDGCYVIVGETMSYGSGLTDVYLLKVDQDGNLDWSKTHGDIDEDRGWSIRPASDGGYIIAGRTRLPTSSYYDIYLIKTDSEGNIGIAEEKERSLKIVNVYPNPSRGRINISLTERVNKIDLFDISGRTVGNYRTASKLSLDLPAGIYFLKVTSSKGIVTKKIIILTGNS